MKTVLTLSPNANDACAFYRHEAIIRRLPGYTFERLPGQVSWSSLLKGDLALLQRPYKPEHIAVAKLIKEQMPLIIDYDDLLLDVPASNPAWITYSPPSAQDAIKELLAMADATTVTTPALAEALAPYARRVIVIPNAYNNFLFPHEPAPAGQSPIVFWRGSDCHKGDLLAYRAPIIAAAKEFPAYKWMFMGAVPWQLAEDMDAHFIRGSDIFPYFQTLRSLGAAVQIVPLQDNLFNRSKSNISWIEGTSGGMTVLAPKWPQFTNPGCFNYADQDSFFLQLVTLLSAPHENRIEWVKQSWHTIHRDYWLSSVNDLRLKLFNELTA